MIYGGSIFNSVLDSKKLIFVVFVCQKRCDPKRAAATSILIQSKRYDAFATEGQY